MWRYLIVGALLAGCAQLPPSPQDAQAKRFETVPGKSVIYIVRPAPEINRLAATLSLDDRESVTTFAGTFYRWEVAPGTHRIAGFAGDGARLTFNTEAGKLYFVQHTLVPGATSAMSFLQLVRDDYGRQLVTSAQSLN